MVPLQTGVPRLGHVGCACVPQQGVPMSPQKPQDAELPDTPQRLNGKHESPHPAQLRSV